MKKIIIAIIMFLVSGFAFAKNPNIANISDVVQHDGFLVWSSRQCKISGDTLYPITMELIGELPLTSDERSFLRDRLAFGMQGNPPSGSSFTDKLAIQALQVYCPDDFKASLENAIYKAIADRTDDLKRAKTFDYKAQSWLDRFFGK